MKIQLKKRTILIIFCAISFTTFSQSTVKQQKTAYCEKINWYIEAGAGAQVLFSTDANRLQGKDRFTPAISLTVGKWITPVWGLRIQAQGYTLNGYSTTNGIYIANPIDNGLIYGNNDPVRHFSTIYPDGSYRHYIRYANIHGDVQCSMANLLFAHPVCRWDIVPSVGIGWMHVFSYKGIPQGNFISSNFSLLGKYKLNKRLDVNLEVQTIVLPDQFEGKITGKNYENNLSLSVGVTYHFKHKPCKEILPAPVEKVVEKTKIIRDTITTTKIVKEEVVKKKPGNLLSSLP